MRDGPDRGGLELVVGLRGTGGQTCQCTTWGVSLGREKYERRGRTHLGPQHEFFVLVEEGPRLLIRLNLQKKA